MKSNEEPQWEYEEKNFTNQYLYIVKYVFSNFPSKILFTFIQSLTLL